VGIFTLSAFFGVGELGWGGDGRGGGRWFSRHGSRMRLLPVIFCKALAWGGCGTAVAGWLLRCLPRAHLNSDVRTTADIHLWSVESVADFPVGRNG